MLLNPQTLDELEALVAERMGFYSGERRLLSIDYRAPPTYISTLQPWS